MHLTGIFALGPQHSHDIRRQGRIAIQNGMISRQLIFPASVRALRDPTLLCHDAVPPGNGYRNRDRVGNYPLVIPETPDAYLMILG